MSETNDLTQKILNHLFQEGYFVWRNNTTGIPLPGGGFRPAAKTGVPDILCLHPPNKPKIAGVEVKVGKDRLRPAQEGFIASARHVGFYVLVVKTFEDYLSQYKNLIHSFTNQILQ